MSLTNLNGKYYSLGRKIGGGGEGSIHELMGVDDSVAKIFRDTAANREKEDKIKVMISMGRNNSALKYTSWPKDILYDNGRFVGFTMPRIPSNLKINEINETSSKMKYSWKSKITIAYNLCSVVNAIHGIGQCCGDFNPNNICVDTRNGSIYLLDTDSFHITSGGRTFRCSVGMGEYMPKQLQERLHNNSLKTLPLPTFTENTDNFALAIHVFQLLMNGCHPFTLRKTDMNDSVCVPTQIENIMNGKSAFFDCNTGFDIPVFSPNIDCLPVYITKLFRSAFVDSYSKGLGVCPKPSDWMSVLKMLANEIVQCRSNPSHYFYSGSRYCPWCEVDRKMSAVIGTPAKPPVVPIRGTTPINFPQPIVNPVQNRIQTHDMVIKKDGLYYHISPECITLLRCDRKDPLIKIDSSIRYGGMDFHVSRIGDHAFEANQALKDVILPSTITSIGSFAFARCSNLRTINIPGSVKRIGESAFSHCFSLEDFTIPGGIRTISDSMFSYCFRLRKVTMNNVSCSIGKYAFSNCYALDDMLFSQWTKSIGAYAFENCYSLEKISIPDSVKTIGEGAFDNCTNLKSVDLPNGLKEIKKHTFKSTGLEYLILPDTVREIGEEAFYCCVELRNVAPMQYLTKIGDRAFSCTHLTVVGKPSCKFRKNAFPEAINFL